MIDGLVVRWAVSADMRDIAAIEEVSFSDPWSLRQIKRTVRTAGVSCLVAEAGGGPIAYLIYLMDGRDCSIERIAVSPVIRRMGVGAALMNRLVPVALDEAGCRRVEAIVHEENMTAQFFFHGIGFRGKSVLRQHGSDAADWYMFEMSMPACRFQGKPRFSLEVGSE